MLLTTLFVILGSHWYGDFCLQTDKEATNKSHSNRALASHVFTYSSFMTFAIFLYQIIIGGGIESLYLLEFFLITFGIHFTTDYCTSRYNAKLWAAGKRHDFFVSIGFDQLLHYIQLMLTYKLLFT